MTQLVHKKTDRFIIDIYLNQGVYTLEIIQGKSVIELNASSKKELLKQLNDFSEIKAKTMQKIINIAEKSIT